MTLGWSIAAASRDARSKRARKSASGANSSGRSFSATLRPSFGCSAGWTTPLPPPPPCRRLTRPRPDLAPLHDVRHPCLGREAGRSCAQARERELADEEGIGARRDVLWATEARDRRHTPSTLPLDRVVGAPPA